MKSEIIFTEYNMIMKLFFEKLVYNDLEHLLGMKTEELLYIKNIINILIK